MANITKMINKTIMEITFLVVLCIISFVVFNVSKVEGVITNPVYTDIDVLKNYNSVGVNDFPKDSQIKLKVSNYSNTSEDYNVLLTSNNDLSDLEDSLKIKIDDKEYLLKDLKVADNYFLIDKGNMKANTKEIDLYFAADDNKQIDKHVPFYFVNDLTI